MRKFLPRYGLIALISLLVISVAANVIFMFFMNVYIGVFSFATEQYKEHSEVVFILETSSVPFRSELVERKNTIIDGGVEILVYSQSIDISIRRRNLESLAMIYYLSQRSDLMYQYSLIY